MKIKTEYLDLKVSSPQNGRPVVVRFIEEGLYSRYQEVYPWLFETETKKEVKKDVISTTKPEQ